MFLRLLSAHFAFIVSLIFVQHNSYILRRLYRISRAFIVQFWMSVDFSITWLDLVGFGNGATAKLYSTKYNKTLLFDSNIIVHRIEAKSASYYRDTRSNHTDTIRIYIYVRAVIIIIMASSAITFFRLWCASNWEFYFVTLKSIK